MMARTIPTGFARLAKKARSALSLVTSHTARSKCEENLTSSPL